MHVVVVRTPEVPPGCGASLTASALAAAGHHVRLLTDTPDTPGTPDRPGLAAPAGGAGSLRVQALAAPGPADLAAAWADAPPDVVHAIGPAAVAAAAGTGLPVVGVVPPGTDAPRVPLHGGIARVVVAGEDQHTALLVHGVPRRILRIVPACVDTDRFTPHGPSLRRGAHPRVVTVGPPVPGSAAAVAIAALPRVPGAELLVAGGPDGADPDRERLFAGARRLGVAGRVRFLGPVPDGALPRLLRSADVVAVAPDRDVPATPALQAMACARPVVAAAVGGLRDAVVDGVTGVHVRPGRAEDLAAALRELLADVAVREAYGAAGRDRARSRFDRARIAGALGALYADAVSGAAGAPAEPGAAPVAAGPGAGAARPPGEPRGRPVSYGHAS